MLTKNVMVYPARLMSPDEVKIALRDRNDVPRLMQKSWYLCGDVTEELWELLPDSRIERQFRVAAFTSPDNTMYAAFCVQLEHRQIRFLMSLAEEYALKFLSEVGQVGLFLSLGKNFGDETSLIEFQVPLEGLEPLLSMAKRAKRLTGVEILEEMKLAVPKALETDFVPSVSSEFEVCQICLNIVLPEVPIPQSAYH